jgi:hypothetical protein
MKQDWGWDEVFQALFLAGLIIIGGLLLIGDHLEAMARRRRRRRMEKDED